MKQGKKFIGLMFALLVVSLIAACSPQAQQSTSGRAVFTMTDAAANMGAVTSIKVTVDSVKVLGENGVWTEVSSKQQTYDLLKLKASGTQVLLADYNLASGTYQQVRLDISKVVVTDASGDHVAKLPSGELKIVGRVKVNDNSTSTVKFDFIADKSLHMTGNGLYIFAPVVKLEMRERADVDTRFKENVRISGGKINEDTEVGMDIDGNVGEGNKIKSDSKLSVNGNRINEEAVQGRVVFMVTDAAANMSTVTSIKMTVDSVKVHGEEGWVNVSSKQQTFDLLKLKADGAQALLADVNLTPGTYQQVRLYISKVVVTDASGDHVAKLPSGELKIVGRVKVNDNSTSTVKFDFIADKSLHMTGNGTYIFAPVIKFETREKAHVEIDERENEDRDTDSKANVRIKDGNVDEDTEVSMDIDGNVGKGLKVREDSRLSVRWDKIAEE